jgi:hypothetical protein
MKLVLTLQVQSNAGADKGTVTYTVDPVSAEMARDIERHLPMSEIQKSLLALAFLLQHGVNIDPPLLIEL